MKESLYKLNIEALLKIKEIAYKKILIIPRLFDIILK